MRVQWQGCVNTDSILLLSLHQHGGVIKVCTPGVLMFNKHIEMYVTVYFSLKIVSQKKQTTIITISITAMPHELYLMSKLMMFLHINPAGKWFEHISINCKSFEDRVPVNFDCGLRSTKKDEKNHDSSSSNGYQATCHTMQIFMIHKKQHTW